MSVATSALRAPGTRAKPRVLQRASRPKKRLAHDEPRKAPKQARARATVAEILEAARRVLEKEGYERASTNRIAEVAGVSVGSLYQYFPSKDAIVAALVQAHVEHLMGAVAAGLAELASAPLDVAARKLVGLMIDAHRVEPDLHRALDAHRARFEVDTRVGDLNRAMRLLVRGYLAGRRAELRADIDLDVATFLVHELVEAATHTAVLEEPQLLDNPRLVDEVATMIVAYLSPPAAPSPPRRIKRPRPT